ncbi:pentatricopeptide repeat-containing protein At4g19220, mitochondrial-like [Amborella trichopoda]|uniref:pentatricopeptide repeat-containing protein At4g19220, mitochondrial-like n=1 Tax=Amborella trichopoda TaxID=13333 RepID=UPI0009BE86BF|nr:pentatricopeptide repeat-containing protein At4g19220, mitochondrial-like [Amborella trichopoda]|eukprot:XP_020519866.1 pentatricopeptide repeat-containing protein At4g19220, mitochondrial-like [Amborella trichopoda]
MRQSGIKLDSTTFLTALSAIRSNLSLQQGKCLHCLAEKSGCLSHVSSATSLFTMYTNVGELGSSWFLFKSLPFKDLVAWNSMIAGLRRNGCYEEALDLFRQMQMDNVGIDSAALVIVIPALSHLGLMTLGMSIPGFSLRHGLDSGFSVENALIDLYAKCKDLRSAKTIFERLHFRETEAWNTMIWGCLHCQKPENSLGYFRKMVLSNAMPDSITLSVIIQDLVSWNSMINAFIENERVSEAFGLLEEMESDGLKPDSVIVVTLISHCSKSKLLEHGQFIHGFVIRRELGLDLTVINSLIDIEALETFAQMLLILINPDPITLVSVPSACGELKLLNRGIWVHGYVLKIGLEFNIHLINALQSMYCKCKDIKSAELIFGSIPNQRNLYSWNSMISGYAQNKQPHKARELFYQMDFEPNEMTLASVLSACAQLGDFKLGEHIHDRITHNGFEQNAFICTALIDMYAKCGRLEEAIQIFKDGRETLSLFSEMLSLGMKPNESTFSSVLRACSHSGLVDEGLAHFDLMFKGFGVSPSTEHYVCIVDSLSRAGRLKEVCEFIKAIPWKPKAGVWGALLSGCKDNGDLGLCMTILLYN